MAEPKASVASSPTTCAACSKRYSDPRLLPCLHSFCLACVKEKLLLEGGKGAEGKVCCVTCKHTSPLPEKGTEGLPQNVHLNYEAKIGEYVSKIHSEECLNCDECDRSEPQPITSFCCTCRGFLCTDCDHQHTISRRLKTHKIFPLEEAREMKDIAKELVSPPPVTCPQHSDMEIKIFCTTCSMLVCMQCAVVTHHGHKFEELPAFAEAKKMETKKGNGKISNAVSKLDAVITQGKAVLKQVDIRKNEVDVTIRDKFQQVYKLMQGRENKLLAENAEIAKVKSQCLTAQISELSSLKEQIAVCSGTVAEAQESHSDTEFLSIAATLQARLEELSQQFEQTPLKLKENAYIAVSVNTATLASEVAKLGRVAAVPKSDVYKSLSKPVMTIESRRPYHVAVHDNGEIFVSDRENHCVHVYDQKGAEKRRIGSKGNGNGQFDGPIGVAVKGDVLCVTEINNHRVQKLTLDGKFISKFGKRGSGEGELDSPCGCTVSGDGKVYVADAFNSRVQVLNPDGTFSRSVGGFSNIRYVAVDTEGNLHIIMVYAKHVKVTTPGGELVREYGGGQLQAPYGVAVDEDGYCLVGDWDGKALHIFDPQGKPVHSIKHVGVVCGVALDKEGSVYVAERGSNAVHKYEPKL